MLPAMPLKNLDVSLPARKPGWEWWICGLLLLATMLNYMDRMTLNQTSDQIMGDFDFKEAKYGALESAFSIAFAVGALIMGVMADRWNVYWLYPAALLVWSAAGFATGFTGGFTSLLLCRVLLGLAEAGNWPCALRTTQRVLRPEQRALGNGILQSGAALGAIITPLVVLGFLEGTGSWRHPFMVIGTVGVVWILLWLVFVRPRDLALPPAAPVRGPAQSLEDLGFWPSLMAIWRQRRFWVLVFLVVAINLTWHFFRAWLPLFLKRGRGYTTEEVQWFTSAYYLATDLGSLSAGFLALWLVRSGWSVHGSRLLSFFLFASLAALSMVAAFLPAGPLLLGTLLVIGFGALGVFPNYYSFSQELTVRHQGKVTGMLGFSCWVSVALLQWVAGLIIEATQSYEMGVALAGLAPLAGFVVLVLFWGETKAKVEEVPPKGQKQPAPDETRIREIPSRSIKR
jgi:ACS family hexuronate transporter-like MFS transporter